MDRIDKGTLSKVQIPESLVSSGKKDLRALSSAGIGLITFILARTGIDIISNPGHYWQAYKTFADLFLTSFQVAPTPAGLQEPGLITADILLGIAAPAMIALAVGEATALIGNSGKKDNSRREVLSRGDLENPLGLIGHTVFLAQTAPFTGRIIEDLAEADHTYPFLVSRTGANQFDPHKNRNSRNEAVTPYWKSTPIVHDDGVLEIADIKNASRMIILSVETDKLIMTGKGEQAGLSQNDAANAIITAYKMRSDLHLLYVIPSSEYVSEDFLQTLKENGVPVGTNFKIVTTDDLWTGKLKSMLKEKGVDEISLDVKDYEDVTKNLCKTQGITLSESAKTVLVYAKEDSTALFEARRIKAKGEKTPILILDTQAEVSQAKNEQIEYICIEDLIRNTIREFVNDTKPEIADYQLDIPISLKALVYNDFEPLFAQKSAAISILKKAVQAMGEEDFFNLLSKIEMVEILNNLYIRRPEAKKMSYMSNNTSFRLHQFTQSNREYTVGRTNSGIMRESMREIPVELLTTVEVLERFFGAKIVDEHEIHDFNAVMQSLYVLGYLYKNGKEFVRYPIKNSVVREMFQELGMIKADSE